MRDKVYVVEKHTAIEALEEVDRFDIKMKNYIVKHPEYSYSMNIDKKNVEGKSVWEIQAKIKKHVKQEDN